MWEYYENYDDNCVKGLLLRAQQRHPEALQIYYIFFLIELENKRESAQTQALQHAEVVYLNGKKKFSDFDYFVDMLSIADKFSYTKPLKERILDDMRRSFPRHELLWHTLAQRELTGLTCTKNATTFLEEVKRECHSTAASTTDEDPNHDDVDGFVDTAALNDELTILSTTDAGSAVVNTDATTRSSRDDTKADIRLIDDAGIVDEATLRQQRILEQQERIERCVVIYDAAVEVVCLNTCGYFQCLLVINFFIFS